VTEQAGWFICYSDDGTPGRWHYFNEKWLRSRCGMASSYQRSIGPVEHTPALSSVALMKAGFCRGCDRTRRREEGR
jgi:hypothetical protein